MAKTSKLAFSHMGLFVSDLPMMRDFYTRLLGYTVTDEGVLNGRAITFLSQDPREHHQIVLCEGRPDDATFTVVNQISLRAESLGELRELYVALDREEVPELVAITHGVAWSIYFRDPEGHRVEVFVDTPWYIDQPHRVPFDIMQPDEAIHASEEARIKDDPSFRPIAEWRAEIAAKMGRAEA
ncbi:MAG: VOC family protein [Pseudomonadota bacterium]